ncbi:MAG: amidohydrolase family protein [Pusillimonas sp.]
MKLIDFNSRPPIPEFGSGAQHLSNYRRVYQNSESATSRDLDSYLSLYQALEVEHVVIKAKDVTSTFGLAVRNELVADFCKAHGPRFIGWAGVDPHSPTAVEELEYAVRRLDLRGLNLQCFEHKLHINAPSMYRLYEACVRLDIPVNIHCGINFSTDCLMEYGRPILLDQVLTDLPGLRVVASPPGWPWVHELIAVAWRHKNLTIGLQAVRPKYLNVAGSGYEGLLTYGKSVLKDQIVFGTSYPMQPIDRAFDEVKTLPLSDAIMERWLFLNAKKLLGV